MSNTERWPGKAALMVAHSAGMVDLVALPVWVGTLISKYRFDPQQAGGLATLFLAGAVAASLVFAPRFNRIKGRTAVSCGFACSALAFAVLSLTDHYPVMAVLHALAGLSTGCALSFTHGTIGRSANPHRLFAMVGLALGIFGIFILGGSPPIIEALGGAVLFCIFAIVMGIAAVVCLVAFPSAASVLPDMTKATRLEKLDKSVWFGIVGVGCMALVQAMTFSFFERIGMDRGFGLAAVTAALAATGFVALIPAPMAALLEGRLSARRVVMTGPVVQAVLAIVITNSPIFLPFGIAGPVFVSVMIFTHTFAFGLLAKLDISSRAVAATPAMLMVGAAIGPILGGTLVKAYGYPSLAVAAALIAVCAVYCFFRMANAAEPTTGMSAGARKI